MRTGPRPVVIRTPEAHLAGDILIPPDPVGIVAFAHGSGSSRHSSRNQHVARALNGYRLATLLLDLLTPDEERIDAVTAQLRFDIDMLGRRMTRVVDWLGASADTVGLPIGLFGASTGAAAALIAAAARSTVRAVVSRGGRPDLAGAALPRVTAPTLLLVGSLDIEVIRLNRAAASLMHGTATVEIIEGASHLFEEPGTLDAVCDRAGAWFTKQLVR